MQETLLFLPQVNELLRQCNMARIQGSNFLLAMSPEFFFLYFLFVIYTQQIYIINIMSPKVSKFGIMEVMLVFWEQYVFRSFRNAFQNCQKCMGPQEPFF